MRKLPRRSLPRPFLSATLSSMTYLAVRGVIEGYAVG